MRKWVKKQKKRIIASILSLVLGVGSAFALSCPAFADSQVNAIECTVTYNYISCTVNTTSFHTAQSAEYLGQEYTNYTQWGTRDAVSYRDIDVIIDESYSFDPSVYAGNAGNFTFFGFLQAYGTIDIFVSPVGSNTSLISYEFLGMETSNIYDYDYSSTAYVYADYQNTNIKRLRITRNELFYSSDFSYALTASSGPVYNRTIYRFRVYGVANDLSVSSPNFSITYNVTATPTGRGSIYMYPSDKYYLYNMNEKLNNISGIENLLQGDDAILDIINDSATATENKINTVDTVIASVAPDADQAIQSVSTVISDNGTFWSNQRNASLFWKEIISDMYDSTIMGYLGVGLSIVLIIILFVFILRL